MRGPAAVVAAGHRLRTAHASSGPVRDCGIGHPLVGHRPLTLAPRPYPTRMDKKMPTTNTGEGWEGRQAAG